MSAPASVPFTYREYARLSDDRRYEVIDGKLFVTPSPRTWHQRICLNLTVAVREHVLANGLGEVLIAPCDVVLSETNVFQPDILFVRRDRISIIEEKYVSGAPDLVVEILSPGTRARDRKLKFPIYARFGVSEMWIGDVSAPAIEVFRNTGERFGPPSRFTPGDILRSAVLPGLRVAVDTIF
jgi:Uma2 family endonuclease